MKAEEQMDKQKAMRLAMNGRMCLLSSGIMMIFIAVTNTMMYGINMFLVAMEASKGTEEIVQMLAESDMTITMAVMMGVCFMLTAVMEMFAGISAVRFANRVDRAFLMKKVVFILLGVEVLMEIVLFFMRSLSLGMLFTAIALPLFMLWGVTRLTKLAKAEPDRVYAVMTEKLKEKQRQEQAAANGKSLRERAMMKAAEPKPQDSAAWMREPENAQETEQETMGTAENDAPDEPENMGEDAPDEPENMEEDASDKPENVEEDHISQV